MRNSVPEPPATVRRQVHADPYVTQYPDQQQTGVARPLTIDDVVTKTGITLAVLTAVAVVSYFLVSQNLALAMPFLLVGMIGGLVLILVAMFGRKQDNPAIVLSYAAFEGLLLGAFSFVVANFMVSGISAGALISQAILGTFGVFFGMLVVYKTGAIRVTPKFTRMLVAALFGAVVLMLGNFVMGLFTDGAGPLRDGGPLAIVFSLVMIGLAAFMLPDRLRLGRPDDPRRRAGEGRMGHRPRPYRHAGVAVPRDPAAAQLLQQRVAARRESPALRCRAFSCQCGIHPQGAVVALLSAHCRQLAGRQCRRGCAIHWKRGPARRRCRQQAPAAHALSGALSGRLST